MNTTTEMSTAANDLVIALGTRDDGSQIRVSQSTRPNVAIFGGAGSGKSVLLSQIVKATVPQGAAVIVADAVSDPDLRKLAPGLTHYSAGCDAALHRSIHYVNAELERRQLHPEEKNAPVLLVLHEMTAWLHGLMQGGDEERAAAESSLARIHRIAAQGREQRVHLLTVGQMALASVFGGSWKTNTGTRRRAGAADGPPSAYPVPGRRPGAGAHPPRSDRPG